MGSDREKVELVVSLSQDRPLLRFADHGRLIVDEVISSSAQMGVIVRDAFPAIQFRCHFFCGDSRCWPSPIGLGLRSVLKNSGKGLHLSIPTVCVHQDGLTEIAPLNALLHPPVFLDGMPINLPCLTKQCYGERTAA